MNLKVLSIQYNEISKLPPGTIEKLDELRYLFINNNAHLDCTCPLIKGIKKIKDKGEFDIKGWCAAPPHLYDRELKSLDPNEMDC